MVPDNILSIVCFPFRIKRQNEKRLFEECRKHGSIQQDKIFRRKRLSTGANFVHIYLEIWDKGILKLNKFSM